MLQNRSVWTAGLIAGALIGLFSSIPVVNLLNCLLCAWVWLGAMFAVWYYKRSNPGILPTADGALIGAIAGAVGALISWGVGLAVGTASIANAFASQAETFGETGDAIVGLLAGSLGSIIILLINLVFYVGFGTLGGILGAMLFGQKRTPDQPGL